MTRPCTKPRCALRWQLLSLALLAGGAAAARAAEPDARLPAPPRLAGAPRLFGRSPYPLEPDTAVGLAAGQSWVAPRHGVDSQQLALSLLAQLQLWRLGVHLELPLWFERASTEGVYGPGEGSTRGAGDLGFGLGARLGSGVLWGQRMLWGASLRASAPTGGSRTITMRAPLLAPPAFRLPPATWTVSGGLAGAALLPAGLGLQLNADLIGHLREDHDHPAFHDDWLLGGLAATLSWRPLPWLTALLLCDAQLELYGRQYELRQMLFLLPGVRLGPWHHTCLQLGLRLPLTPEARDELRLAVGGTLTLHLGGERHGR